MNHTLLAKYLFHETSRKEKAEVEKWLSESEANRRELEELQKRIDLTRRYRAGTFNVSKAWCKFQQSISPARAIVPFPLFRYAAAIVLLFLVLGGAFYFSDHRPVEILTVQSGAGETLEVILPDSSVVTLSGVAELNYPISFTGETRRVDMKGKIYFQVHKNPRQPFLVNTGTIQATVLGTTFQIVADNRKAEIMVNSGRVKVALPGEKNGEELTAGMSAIYTENSQKIIRADSFDINQISWKTQVFQFNETPLPEVVRILNEHYKANIQLPETARSLKLTATFEKVSLDEILEIVNQTMEIKVKNEK